MIDVSILWYHQKRPKPPYAHLGRLIRNTGDVWLNYVAAIETAPSHATHMVIMHDDLDLHPQFWQLLPTVIAARPDSILTLFSMRKVITDAFMAGVPWAIIKAPLMGQCVVWPRKMALELLEFVAEHINLSAPYEDTKTRLFCALTGNYMYATAPCLVEHAGAFTSTAGIQGAPFGRPRVANLYLPDYDLSSIDWRHPGPFPVDGGLPWAKYRQYVKPDSPYNTERFGDFNRGK